jgi:hypothetical protein
MVAGADSVEDLDLLRHGGMTNVFASVYAPSTLGSFLRFFTWGHALQLEAAARDLLAALAARTPLLPGAGQLACVDVDSLLRRVYGPAKQGAAFGHAKVGGYNVRLRGLSPLVAAISTEQAAPVASGRILVRGDIPATPSPPVCRPAHKQVWRFTIDSAVPFTNKPAEQPQRMVKLQMKIGGCWRSVRTAARYCLVRSYLATARNHRVHPLDALRDALAGNPWPPPQTT